MSVKCFHFLDSRGVLLASHSEGLGVELLNKEYGRGTRVYALVTDEGFWHVTISVGGKVLHNLSADEDT
jgi:hypothetical protein